MYPIHRRTHAWPYPAGSESVSPFRRHAHDTSPPVHGEIKPRPLPHSAFRPDPTAIPVDDPLHRGKADAGAREIVLGMQALKRAKQLLRQRHVEPRPIVVYKTCGFPMVQQARIQSWIPAVWW